METNTNTKCVVCGASDAPHRYHGDAECEECYNSTAPSRTCVECGEDFEPSMTHRHDAVCDECVSEKGKTQRALETHDCRKCSKKAEVEVKCEFLGRKFVLHYCRECADV